MTNGEVRKMAKLLINFTPAEGQAEAAEQYSRGATPMFAAAGITPAKPSRIVETIAGVPGLAMSLVMDFDDVEAVSAVFSSDAYQKLIPLRDAGFSNIQILITQDTE